MLREIILERRGSLHRQLFAEQTNPKPRRRHWFAIYKDCNRVADRPYRVIEQFITSDGIRSRVCERQFRTHAEAEAWISFAEAELS